MPQGLTVSQSLTALATPHLSANQKKKKHHTSAPKKEKYKSINMKK